jgi:hypothetical protein
MDQQQRLVHHLLRLAYHLSSVACHSACRAPPPPAEESRTTRETAISTHLQGRVLLAHQVGDAVVDKRLVQ